MLLTRSAGEKDIGRLHVAVHQPALVRGVERARHLADEHQRSPRCEGAFRSEQRLQVGPHHVPHRDVEKPVDLAGLVDGDDVRVIEGRGQLRLAQESDAKPLVLRELGRQELQRHVAFQPQIVAEVDDAHASASQHALDAVARQLGADAIFGYDRHVSSVRRGPG